MDGYMNRNVSFSHFAFVLFSSTVPCSGKSMESGMEIEFQFHHFIFICEDGYIT